ncbi:MAG: serine hydrolase [Candidatus Marinimicrobia bacterium]|nr:serine hydrolase [Candidatus Neomarinimicrobiota bacterium]MBT3633426.1 serine hydrolase [Candidatus Neomarinimicrobiota bacterium]MBT3681569.1 serine hydrolase [Candidatus Neomarinimicrobiota bacterium]MBT3758464.1 serine hydrolase [Candidatus Neomarinimicrobiota bacterium]MBT3894882.1 serine hydrolase [Candidatus Neomarinimicrobiota bacterium]
MRRITILMAIVLLTGCQPPANPVPEPPIQTKPSEGLMETDSLFTDKANPILSQNNDSALVSSVITTDPAFDNSGWESLNLREKIAQMIMVRIRGDYFHEKHWMMTDMKYFTENTGIGGVIIFGGSIHGAYSNIQQYQKWSKIPLLVAADYERGTGQWFDGGTLFPPNMAMTATGNPQLAFDQGKITALEAKSLGVHVTFAPVMDVNNNPNNPIINFRSYGDNPQQVSDFGNRFIEGFQSQGLIACVKHFPGHGNTSVDSHSSLPVISGNRDALNKVEFLPFKTAVENGVKMVMTGHIALPEIDGNVPASHSFKMTSELLREEWGFQGLVVTDGMEMAGLTKSVWAGESAVRAVEAGTDILLLPMNVKQSIDALEQAVQSGRISESRIDESVARIFKAKKDLGLFTNSGKSTFKNLESIVGIKSHMDKAKKIARSSITVVKNDGSLPLKPEKIEKLGHLILTTDDNGKDKLYPFIRGISQTHGNVSEYIITEAISDIRINEILSQLKKMDQVIVSLLIRIHMGKGRSTIDDSHDKLLTKMKAAGIKFVTVSFGSPYLKHYDHLATYMCAYGYGTVSLKAAADAVWGRIQVTGTLPVTLNKYFTNGYGIEIPARSKVFTKSTDNYDLSKAWAVLDSAIENRIFPGAQVFIAKDGQIISSYAVGHQTYAENSQKVTTSTIYDVASLTKVLVTTPVTMKLSAKNLLGIDQKVSQFYPEFLDSEKKDITIRHLLTHSSGLKPYIRFFLDEDIHDRDDVLREIINSDLESKPGEKYAYSDLGVILLGSINEKVSGSSLKNLASRYIIKPFKMDRTIYNPKNSFLKDIAPTEIDETYRKKLVHGIVHDENAFLLGGIAPHAGIFSTAENIGNYSQMLINGGTFLGKRYFDKYIIDKFTTRQNMPSGSDRALGWDTPSQNGNSSAGDYFSPSSFGHLGFTGTSMWIDPEQKIMIILLTNRVHPTRERGGIYSVRRRFHTEVMKSILK